MNAWLRMQRSGEELAKGRGDGGTQEGKEQGLQPPSWAWTARPARCQTPPGTLRAGMEPGREELGKEEER